MPGMETAIEAARLSKSNADFVDSLNQSDTFIPGLIILALWLLRTYLLVRRASTLANALPP